ncbi:DUF4270 domain-containing protein [Flavobacterium algicola]|uniref:DUF4270 domain-containing protein n=1 Tax=Flavobacterium algicola TaxID=556529 RepID=UPI001EFCAA51|nr:DUF4270 domain-containing protein [Flavobacterium algicola]MCG9791766.1 DUF4270 domain-containing protein [Flavobacterium algicola]
MYSNSFFKKVLLIFSVVLISSCDKDFNSIGSDIVGDNHFDFEKYTSDIVAYNQKITAIQSSNQEINPLGILDNPDFGTTTANFVTQLSLSSVVTSAGVNPVVESVVLSIPYYIDATQTVTDTEGKRTYVLDSIYGDEAGKLKLSVFRSNYYLRSLDPVSDFVNSQLYYTDQNSLFSSAKVGERLNNATDKAENDEFFFDKSGFFVAAVATVSEAVYTTPEMRLNLNKDYFQSTIVDAIASGKLASNDVFTEYFRGLYFQVEKSGASASNLAMLNFAAGKITVNYKNGEDAARVDNSIVLNMIGNKVSLLEQTDTKMGYTNAINNADSSLGDSKLYVKGGEGSMAILKLFDKGDLATIKTNNWLVNEANIIFHVDKTSLTSADKAQPQRLYLYDFTNNTYIIDYFDGTTGTTKASKNIYGGILTKDADDEYYYKFRVTNHIRNLISKDSTNVKLGLVVTENILNITNAKLKTASTNFTKAPVSSVMNPLGTILYGSTAGVEDKKRLKLEIYYTKPN